MFYNARMKALDVVNISPLKKDDIVIEETQKAIFMCLAKFC